MDLITSNGNGHNGVTHYGVLAEAKSRGIATSYNSLAQKLKLSPITLANLDKGTSSPNRKTVRRIERLFKQPLKKMALKPAEMPATPTPKPVKITEAGYAALFAISADLREKAREVLQSLLDGLTA